MCLILDSFNSRSAGKIHWAAIDRHARRAGVSIPAVRVRYIYIGPEMEDANGVSIPAVRVRYISSKIMILVFGLGFNSRSAGKIHSSSAAKYR